MFAGHIRGAVQVQTPIEGEGRDRKHGCAVATVHLADANVVCVTGDHTGAPLPPGVQTPSTSNTDILCIVRPPKSCACNIALHRNMIVFFPSA